MGKRKIMVVFKGRGELMDIYLITYFVMVFLGLQQLYKFDRKTNNALVLFGNILIIEWCIINKELALLILTVLMMTAQLSRLYLSLIHI